MISETTTLNKKITEQALNSLMECITAELAQGNSVSLTGFGVLTVKERAARQGRNPATGLSITIPAKRAITFRPQKKLKDAVEV